MRCFLLFCAQQGWSMTFLAFVGLGFVAPSLPFWALFFYLLFVPIFLLRLLSGAWCALPPVAYAGVALMGWSLCSFLWSSSWYGIWDVCCTVVFVLGGLQALANNVSFNKCLRQVVIFGSSLNSVVALGEMVLGIHPYLRPGGAGMLHVTLPAAIIAGISVLWSCESIIVQRRFTYLFSGALVVGSVFMTMTASRMPLFAFFCALLWLIVKSGRIGLRVLFLVSLSVLFLGIVIPHMVLGNIQEAFQRNDSFHYVIWCHVWHEALEMPLIGHGIGALTRIQVMGQLFAHAHNLYLEIFYTIGGIGFFLFLMAFLIPVKTVIIKRQTVIFPVIIYISLVLFTDMARPFKGPSEIWYILWLIWLYSVAGAQEEARKVSIAP